MEELPQLKLMKPSIQAKISEDQDNLLSLQSLPSDDLPSLQTLECSA